MHLRPGCCARADPSLPILVPPSISKPPSISLSRWPSVHPVVRPPPSLSCLPPASSVLSPRRCTLRSGPTRSHAAPPITICEAQHPRHASIWKPCPTARSLGHQAKHEHTVLTQCQVGAHCVSESAVPAAPPSLLSDGCYCCCGDRLGTRRWRWLYLRCLLAVARQRLLLCIMLTLSSPAMLRRSLEGAVLCAVLPAKRNPNLIQIMFERSGIEPSPPKAPLLSLGGPMTSLQCGMSYFVWGCFFADRLPAFVFS